jgi:hypothetical protein
MAEAGAAGKLKVFISYSRAELMFADELVAGLEVMGFDVTIDRQSIVEGEDWKKRLGALITDADTVVFILSPASAKSDICAWEVEEAAQLSKRIIPVLAKPLEGISAPARLAALNYVRFDEGRSFMVGLKALATALKANLDWLREHTRLLARAMEWQAGGRSRNRLLSGGDIAAAKAWAAQRAKDAPEPTMLHLDFIKASEQEELNRVSVESHRIAERERLVQQAEAAQGEREAARRREAEALKRGRRNALIGAAVALVLALVAGGFGFYAQQQQKQAIETRNAALLNQSKYLADVSREVLEKDKDPGTAMLLALEALPDKASDDEFQRDRPYWAPAEVSLAASQRLLRELAILKGYADDVSCVGGR